MRHGAFVRAALVAGVGCLLLPSGVDADEFEKAAWWYRTTTSQAPAVNGLPDLPDTPEAPASVPGPPDVAAGQLLVEGTPEGATAVAGATWLLAEDESNPSLTLTAVGASVVPADAVILACRAAVSWVVPESGQGAWPDKPLVDCSASVTGIVAEADGATTVSFGLAPLMSGPELDVVFVPGTTGDTPDGTNGSTFRLVFEAPGPEALDVVTGGAPPSLVTDTPGPSPTLSSGSFTTPSFTGPGGATIDLSFTPPSGAPVAQPALDPVDQAPAVPRLDQPIAAPTPLPADGPLPARTVGLLFLLVAAVAGAWGWYTGSWATAPAMIGLGRFRREAPVIEVEAQVVHGGLGRFARERHGPPPPIA